MIDFRTEGILTLSEAVAHLPAPNGKCVSVASLWRWAKKGVKGVRLEHVRVGRRLCTSKEALDRFMKAVTAADDADSITLDAREVRRPDGSAAGGSDSDGTIFQDSSHVEKAQQ